MSHLEDNEFATMSYRELSGPNTLDYNARHLLAQMLNESGSKTFTVTVQDDRGKQLLAPRDLGPDLESYIPGRKVVIGHGF